VIRDAAYHLQALRTNRKILDSLRALWEPKAARIDPEKVIEVLNKAGVGFVIIGSYGMTGYRDEPQATQDLDILVRATHHRKAVAAIQDTYPRVHVQKESFATRFHDPRTGKTVIDLWKPVVPLLKIMWLHVFSICGYYQIPRLEMALACMLTTMLDSGADPRRYLDAADVMNIVQTNWDWLDIALIRELGEKVAPGRGKKYIRYVREAKVNRMSGLFRDRT
jgi:hypothetical protein